MPLPSIYETAEQYLFTDRDKIIASGVSASVADRIIRIRAAYSLWLQFPSKRDRDIVDFMHITATPRVIRDVADGGA